MPEWVTFILTGSAEQTDRTFRTNARMNFLRPHVFTCVCTCCYASAKHPGWHMGTLLSCLGCLVVVCKCLVSMCLVDHLIPVHRPMCRELCITHLHPYTPQQEQLHVWRCADPDTYERKHNTAYACVRVHMYTHIFAHTHTFTHTYTSVHAYWR